MTITELYWDSTNQYRIIIDERSNMYFIEVLCGSGGLYMAKSPLTKDEFEMFKQDHKSLNSLASEIRFSPEKILKERSSIKPG